MRGSSSPTTPSPQNQTKSSSGDFSSLLGNVGRALLFVYFCYLAVTIRLFAVENYGRVIHEFDPWFNYRATEYLVAHGYTDFVNWFDYESWYPIGRPVGTTIYPGMMITAAGIYKSLISLGFDTTVNDVCVFIPAGFAVLTISFAFLLAYEITRNANAAIITMGFMAIIPSHLMRSVAGGYDNESVAMFIIVATFFFWIRSLRDDNSWWIGIITGFFYTYMACTWGAYTYVLNLIALHAFCLLLLGKFSGKLHKAYSLFFIFGTAGALQFPIVGNQPFDSMEQISALLVFIIMQLLFLVFTIKEQQQMNEKQFRNFLMYFGIGLAVVGALVLRYAYNEGKLLPVTARIRGLFVQHTKTGNPLVDSVAEHQSTPPDVYSTYFNFVALAAPLGFILSFVVIPKTESASFFWLYFLTSGYFSQKMIRLVLLLAPSACVSASILLASLFEWVFEVFEKTEEEPANVATNKKGKKVPKQGSGKNLSEIANAKFGEINKEFKKFSKLRMVLAFLVFFYLLFLLRNFHAHSFGMAQRLSEPQIVLRGKGRDGNPILVNDFIEGYHWLRDNTPENSRVLSWWDYGYQINGVANRTSIADGNTWNHEHIALLGRVLISPEKESHEIARHLADYVLVWTTRWAGMMGDDLAKCPHMARIAGSVFFDIPFHDYYMMSPTQPSPALGKSLLYQLHNYRLNPAVPKPEYFDEVYTTQNRMVRIYKIKDVDEESRKFADEYHTYPPALDPILAQSNSFHRDREHQFLGL